MAPANGASSARAGASPSLRAASAARSSSHDRAAATILASRPAVSTSASAVPGLARTTTSSRASGDSPTVALYSTVSPCSASRRISWVRSRTAVVYRSLGRYTTQDMNRP